MRQTRELFSQTRKIDRTIEKVIDYSATAEGRLALEVDEYEVTPSVERGMRRFLEAFDEGARGGEVTEIGVWVSGFYGSGKSSFTKYLGLALDRACTIGGVPFVDRLADRFPEGDLGARLRTVAKRHRTSVFMVDLGTDQLAESAGESVANVLYLNVLKALGFSREKKVAELELRLERDGFYDAFKRAYTARYPDKEPWLEVHNDPTLAVLRASALVPAIYPDDYKSPSDFRQLAVQPIQNVAELAGRMIGLIRRYRECDNIVFFVDEVGQYVAPRQELILTLDGFARALKELGEGRVWFVATAQQKLDEISEKATINSPELFKLRDRFPINVDLEATDIRTITANRLLTKSREGEAVLRDWLKAHSTELMMHTHLAEWPGGRTALTPDDFVKLYPFLPVRFDLVLALIRALARRRGGTGLRSAIRLVQDLLVDNSHTLPKGVVPLADRPIGRLATVEDLYDTLRQDVSKDYPQAVEAVHRIAQHADFKDDPWALRVAKAVAVLQPLETYPRTAENIAALLYAELGEQGHAAEVAHALHRLVDAREFGLVELRADAATEGGAGFVFLSDEVLPIQKKRDTYVPPQADLNAVRIGVLRAIFEPPPSTLVDGVKAVTAALRFGKAVITGESGEVLFRLEEVDASALEARAEALRVETQIGDAHKNTAFWLFARPDADDDLRDVCRSEFIQAEGGRGKEVPNEVSRLLRSEGRRADRARDAVRTAYQRALQKGVFVFDGRRRALEELGTTVAVGAEAFLREVAAQVFRCFGLVKKKVDGEVAARFLEVDRLDRMPKERDPLRLVQIKANRPSINVAHPALAEAMRRFRELTAASGTGRVQGTQVLEVFNAAPYGWHKDTTRYLFAALLMAGEIEIHSGDSVLRTAGPKAVEALRNTQSFNRVGVAPRGQPVPVEALDRASRRLEEMFAVEVLPLEDQVSRVVRAHFPGVMERVGSLPDRLRLLELRGEDRARAFLQTCADLLKEDAGGAATHLGGVECSIPSEEKWASGVVKALQGDGEDQIRTARSIPRRLGELSEMFAAVEELLRTPATVTIEEVLGSESFHLRMADLRAAVRSLREAVLALYRTEQARLVSAQDEARRRLEARPSWTEIEDEDRGALLRELTGPLLPDPQDRVVGLQRVLTRKLGLAALEDRLGRKADELAAPAVPVEASAARHDGGAAPVVPVVAPVVETVAVGDLLPEGPLADADDVERWIAGLRARLLELVQAGPIRLRRGA